MKSTLLTAPRKLMLMLWAILFAALLGYGIWQHFENLWLYAIAMALASWGVVGWGLQVVQSWRNWRNSVRE